MKKLLMGNEAFAQAALEAGVGVVAGYPGTPSSELAEAVSRAVAAGTAHGVYVEWSTNEKSALEVVAGASMAGARALFTCKQVGLNVASDALLSLNYLGAKGGLVVFAADDPGPISSQTEQDTRRFAAFAKVPVLDPATPEQGFAMMKEAFELSERYNTPVIIRPTTRICHASAFFEVEEQTQARKPIDDGFVRDLQRWVMLPRRAFSGHAEINERLPKIGCEPSLAQFNPRYDANGASGANCKNGANGANGEDAQLGIMAGGVSTEYALEALDMLAARAEKAGTTLPPYRFLQVGTPYPFPTNTVAAFTEGLERVLVLEELDFTLEESLLAFAGRTHASFYVFGKLTDDVPGRGELSTDIALGALAKFLGVALPSETPAAGASTTTPAAAGAASAAAASTGATAGATDTAGTAASTTADSPIPEPPARPPVLCAGCPHRGSFYAVKKALGKTPAVYCGDIGCYTLGNGAPLDAVDTCLCMGAGITMAQGISVVDPQKKALAFIGDSTFYASGLTGIANAVYNQHDITVCILDNSATAMTGGQPHPGTGVTLMGGRHEGINTHKLLEAFGIQHIEEANPLNFEESRAAAERAIFFEGPSAIIFKSPCIQLIKPSTPVRVDPQKCTGCKRCIKEIGCPALTFDAQARGEKSGERGQTKVDRTLCYGCDLCSQICPFGALAKEDSND